MQSSCLAGWMNLMFPYSAVLLHIQDDKGLGLGGGGGCEGCFVFKSYEGDGVSELLSAHSVWALAVLCAASLLHCNSPLLLSFKRWSSQLLLPFLLLCWIMVRESMCSRHYMEGAINMLLCLELLYLM